MSRWNMIENIAAKIGKLISSVLALSQNIEKFHIAVLSGIIQDEQGPVSI